MTTAWAIIIGAAILAISHLICCFTGKYRTTRP